MTPRAAMTCVVVALSGAGLAAPPSPRVPPPKAAKASPKKAPAVAPPIEAPPEVPVAAPTAAAQPAAAVAPDTKERRTLRLAVYELKTDGVDPRVGTIVTDAVVAELRKLQRISVVSMDEVRAMLDVEAQKQLTGCSEESCVAEIAEALGVDGIVIGNLANVGGENIFGLRRIDQREARTLGQVNQRLQSEKGAEYLAAVGPAIETLFPEFSLRPGVDRGVADEVALRMNPPPLPPIVFWSTVGTSAALGVASLGALTVNVLTFTNNEASLRAAVSKPVSAAQVKAEQELIDQTFWATVALGGGAVVGAAASAVIALFTDWNGYGDER